MTPHLGKTLLQELRQWLGRLLLLGRLGEGEPSHTACAASSSDHLHGAKARAARRGSVVTGGKLRTSAEQGNTHMVISTCNRETP